MHGHAVEALSFQQSYSSEQTNRFLSKVNMRRDNVLPCLHAAHYLKTEKCGYLCGIWNLISWSLNTSFLWGVFIAKVSRVRIDRQLEFENKWFKARCSWLPKKEKALLKLSERCITFSLSSEGIFLLLESRWVRVSQHTLDNLQ